MGFVAAGFSAKARGAGYVEIAERDVVEARVRAIVGKDLFKGELGFAVGIDGGLGMVLGDREDARFAVDGAGGGKDEIVDAVAKHGVEQKDAAGDVGDIEDAGLLHGLLDESFAGEVHYGVDVMAAEDGVECSGIAEIGLVEESFGRDGGAMALGEIVESDYVDAGGDE
jgi:hypothetical protein